MKKKWDVNTLLVQARIRAESNLKLSLGLLFTNRVLKFTGYWVHIASIQAFIGLGTQGASAKREFTKNIGFSPNYDNQ